VKAAREIEPSLNIRLLEDLRTIFEGEDSLSTKDVLARLCLLEDAPWNDLKGKPITDRQLSQRLGAYGVKSKTVRIGAATPRGYARADLHDLWRRYLPPLAAEIAPSATPHPSATARSQITKTEAQQAVSISNRPAVPMLRLLRMTLRLVADQAGRETLMEQAMLCLLRMLRLPRGTGEGQASPARCPRR
jgi:hypothetical protein